MWPEMKAWNPLLDKTSRAFQASARRPSGSRTPVWVSPPSLTSRGRPRAAGPAG